MSTAQISLAALPIFFAFVGLEAWYYRRYRPEPYKWSTSLVNIVLALGYLMADALTAGFVLGFLGYLYQHYRIFTIEVSWVSVSVLVVLVDFTYYWLHRFMHEIRWFWGLHSVHHSAQQITLSVSYRLGWTKFISGTWLFLVPLTVLGFEPKLTSVVFLCNLLYQFWLHTELVPKLGVLEFFLCTPSHHRVHHAINPEYLDRNYGGILIVWDKWFGTFTPEADQTSRRYGLIHQINTSNPIKIAFAEYVSLFRDLRSARSLRAALGYLFAAPGWQPDGKSWTTREIRGAAGRVSS